MPYNPWLEDWQEPGMLPGADVGISGPAPDPYDLPDPETERRDKFLALLDQMSKERANPPQGFLDRLAMQLQARPIQTAGRPGNAAQAFLGGFVPQATQGFAANRVRSRGLAAPDLAGRMDMLKLAVMGAEQEGRDNTGRLARATQLAGLKAKERAAPALTEEQKTANEVARRLALKKAGVLSTTDTIGATPLDPAVANMLGGLLLQTGQIGVPLGRNPAGAVNTIGRAAIAQSGGASPDLGTAKASFRANSGALTKLVTQSTALETYSNAAKKNGDTLRKMLSSVPQSGSSWTNAPLRDIAKATGSVDMSRYDALMKTVATEYTRLINNPNLTGVLTDSDKAEGKWLLDRNATGAQVIGALDVLAAESGNRGAALREGIKALQDEIKGGVGGEKKAVGRFNPATGKVEMY